MLINPDNMVIQGNEDLRESQSEVKKKSEPNTNS